ncbi:MAG TPA: hypothetical protein VGB74_10935 [Actinoplanes sp.]|jgi:hypothetical protein
MRKITKRSAAIAAAIVVAVGGGGAAWAAWTVNNSATASASSGSALPVQIEGAALTRPLVPGSSTGVKFTVKNPNPFKVSVTGITLTNFATSKLGCTADTFLMVPGAAVTPFQIPAKTGADTPTTTVTFDNSIKLKANPSTSCQGAPITFKVNVAGESVDS